MRVGATLSTSIDSTFRRLCKFLGMGKDDTQECLIAAPAGIDSNPIKDLRAIYDTAIDQNIVIGFINKNQVADAGEIRLFSVDGDGALKIFLWVKNDGTIEFGGNTGNLTRFQELETGFNQLKSDFNALVTVFNAHIHATPSGASSPTATPATSSTASIANAKINELKTL